MTGRDSGCPRSSHPVMHYFTELTSCACLAYMETLTMVCCLRSARECELFESEKKVTVCRAFFCHCSSFPSA